MTHRQISAGALVMATGTIALLVALYWRQILDVLALLIVGRLSWHYLRARLGIKRRPKSSWSSLLRSGAIAFAAWNTRWLKPHEPKATITAKVGEIDRPDPFGDFPEGF